MTKRVFDVILALISLAVFGFMGLFFWLVASLDTKSNGLFIQNRIGQFGKVFKIYKLKTIDSKTKKTSTVGHFFRKTKMDEWPQLINVLKGDMSIVGPRPDIPGYYDVLEGENTKILKLKPGLTSLASLKYFDEELLLAQQENPLHYNDEMIFPDKVRMNLDYYYNRSLLGDLKIIWKTVFRKKINE